MKGYRVPIEFKEENVSIDPYMLGYYLGSNNSINLLKQNIDKSIDLTDDLFLDLCNIDKELFSEIREKNNIPKIYKCNSRKNRFVKYEIILHPRKSFRRQTTFSFWSRCCIRNIT